MTSPVYPTNPTDRRPAFPTQRDYGPQDDETAEILQKIQRCRNLSEIRIDDITKESGIAEKLAKKYKGNLNTTQLRKFFDKIVMIQENLKKENLKNTGANWKKIEPDFYMIRPNLAYARGRKLIPDEFYKLISLCLERIAPEGSSEEQKMENYKRFVELLQSLVAYSKYYEKK